MVTYSSHPKTLDEVQAALQKHLGDPGRKKPSYTIDRPSPNANRLCLVSHAMNDLRYEVRPDLLQIVAKSWRLHLYLDPFLVSSEFAKDKFCLFIETHPDADHRHFSSVLRELTTTKHPAFYSRVLRAFRRLENNLPATLIDEATAAPTDYLVAVEALSSAPETTELIAEDPFVAAKFRGLKRKQQMLEASGGALTSEQVAEILGISRQAVDKRRAADQLLALTQGGEGTAIPASSSKTVRPSRGSKRFSRHSKISIRGCRWCSSAVRTSGWKERLLSKYSREDGRAMSRLRPADTASKEPYDGSARGSPASSSGTHVADTANFYGEE